MRRVRLLSLILLLTGLSCTHFSSTTPVERNFKNPYLELPNYKYFTILSLPEGAVNTEALTLTSLIPKSSMDETSTPAGYESVRRGRSDLESSQTVTGKQLSHLIKNYIKAKGYTPIKEHEKADFLVFVGFTKHYRAPPAPDYPQSNRKQNVNHDNPDNSSAGSPLNSPGSNIFWPISRDIRELAYPHAELLIFDPQREEPLWYFMVYNKDKEVHFNRWGLPSLKRFFKGLPYYADVGGIGIQLDDRLAINNVLEGSPAKKSGLQVGDVIMSIDGRIIRNLSQCRKMLKGMPNTKLSK